MSTIKLKFHMSGRHQQYRLGNPSDFVKEMGKSIEKLVQIAQNLIKVGVSGLIFAITLDILRSSVNNRQM